MFYISDCSGHVTQHAVVLSILDKQLRQRLNVCVKNIDLEQEFLFLTIVHATDLYHLSPVPAREFRGQTHHVTADIRDALSFCVRLYVCIPATLNQKIIELRRN